MFGESVTVARSITPLVRRISVYKKALKKLPEDIWDSDLESYLSTVACEDTVVIKLTANLSVSKLQALLDSAGDGDAGALHELASLLDGDSEEAIKTLSMNLGVALEVQ